MDPQALREARATWDAIARSFDATRRTPWPPVVEFIQGLPPASRLLDAGVGNGRHARVAAEAGHTVVGLDLSGELLRTAQDKAQAIDAVQGVLEALPFPSRRFDAAICIATLHHVRGRPHRVAALSELRRVLRPGRPALVSVWARDQPRFEDAEAPLRTPRATAASPVEPGDVELTWSQHGLHAWRFVHLYDAPELTRDLEDAGFETPVLSKPTLSHEGHPDNHFALVHAPDEPL